MRRTSLVLSALVALPLAAVSAPAAHAVPASAVHADECPPTTDRWEVADLGFQGYPRDINNRGQIIGDDPETDRGFLWEDGRLTDLGTLPGGWRSIATGIDDEGRITGTSAVAGDVKDHAYLWQNGQMRDIGTFLPDAVSRGVVVGGFIDTTQPVDTNRWRAVRWRDGKLTRLKLAPASHARDVNETGQVAGSHGITGDFTPYYKRTDRAYLLEGEKVHDLGTLGSNWSESLAVNDRGQVVGHSSTRADGFGTDGFFWSPQTGIKLLPRLQGEARVTDINDSELIAGYFTCSTAPYGPAGPAVWTGHEADPRLLPLLSGFSGARVIAVNDRGEMVGTAHSLNGGGPFTVVMWRPKG
ncbi:hypothetical protein [Streptosporangium sp. LJ11]|uniref:hypothetical protein n=1 Tax=Streptosporangium sp. LJ11 TaxID=3436927 RepID=UPI003F7AA557